MNEGNMTHCKIGSIAKMYGIDVNLVDEWSKLDPTNNMQYLMWIARLTPKKEDYNKVREALKKFHVHKSRLSVKDINKYSTLGEVMDLFDSNVRSLDGIKVIYEGIYGKLLIPTTYKGSMELSRGTRWCTTDKETYYEYESKGSLYVWIDYQWNKLEGKSKKYQLHFETTQFMNERDEDISKDLLTYFRLEHPVISKLFAEYENDLTDLEDINTYIKFVHGIEIDRFMDSIMDNPYAFADICWKDLNGRSDIDDLINKDDRSYVERCIVSSKHYDENRIVTDEKYRQYCDVLYKGQCPSYVTDPTLKLYHEVYNLLNIPNSSLECKEWKSCNLHIIALHNKLVRMIDMLKNGPKSKRSYTGERDYEYERKCITTNQIYFVEFTNYLLSLGVRYNTLAYEEKGITQSMVNNVDMLLIEYNESYAAVHERKEGYDREVVDYYGLTLDHLKYISHNIHKINLETLLQSPKLTRKNILDIAQYIPINNPIHYLIHSLISNVRDENIESIPKDIKYYPYYWRKFGGSSKDKFMELNKPFLNVEHAFHYITRTHI